MNGAEIHPGVSSSVYAPFGSIERPILRPNTAPYVWYPLFPRRFKIDTASFATVLFLSAFALRTRGKLGALAIRTRLGDNEHERDGDR